MENIKNIINNTFLKDRKEKFIKEESSSLLKVTNLTKRYKKNMPPAISNLNFEVGHGEFHVFIGGNGAGKTTSIKSIVGAYANYEGEIRISGYLNNSVEAKRLIGYIPEVAKFPEGMSSYTYLVSMAELSGVSKEEAKKFATKTLSDFKMDKLSKKSPNTFSSGQKKKILLAQSLVHSPKLLIMDEPAANLDPRARIDFFQTIKKLQLSGCSIFISSHILTEVDKYATHATILDGGKIVFTGSLKQFRNKRNKDIILKTKDNKKIFEILEKEKYEVSWSTSKEDCLIISNLNESKTKELLTKINELTTIIIFERFLPNLEDIYKEYVIKGSVHTMTEEKTK